MKRFSELLLCIVAVVISSGAGLREPPRHCCCQILSVGEKSLFCGLFQDSTQQDRPVVLKRQGARWGFPRGQFGGPLGHVAEETGLSGCVLPAGTSAVSVGEFDVPCEGGKRILEWGETQRADGSRKRRCWSAAA
ncbi:MAG: hypothetical protein ACQKBU_11870 [Verrucomicrobiales bacterium]